MAENDSSQAEAAETAGSPATPAPPETYEAAVERLEAIIVRLDSGRAELRETLELCREGKALAGGPAGQGATARPFVLCHEVGDDES